MQSRCPILVLRSACLLLCALPLTCAGELLLSADGKTEYAIWLAEDAIAPEQTAAQELAKHLQQVTGADFAVLQGEQAATAAKRIIVGPADAARALTPKVDWEALGHDGIVIKTVGETLLLAGGRPRGTLYAVYTFLEDVVGCRWWTSTESYVPRRPQLTVADLDKTYVPPLLCREAFYRDAFKPVFASRLKCNGHFERIPPERGGHYNLIGWCHTFEKLLPPERYFATHPDWYNLLDGARSPHGQLCCTNPEMQKELTQRVLEWLRDTPDAGMISVSQNDGTLRGCQCEQCLQMDAEEGSPSGAIIRLVNEVAQAVEQEFPDVLVETLAYSYARKPPAKARPRDNVVIRFCTSGSRTEPLETGEVNAKARAELESWSRIAPKLYIWHYVANYGDYLSPFPNLRVLGSNIRYFIKNKTVGMFVQGDGGCACGDFVQLRAWLTAHLLWDPYQDEHELLREFVAGYYGPAGPSVLAYLNLIHDAAEDSDLDVMRQESWYDNLEVLNRATELFDEAAATVGGDPVLAGRVRRAKLCIDHVWIKHYTYLSRRARREGRRFLGPSDLGEAIDRFAKTAHEFDARMFSEHQPFSEYEQRLRERQSPSGPPPELCKDLQPEQWEDIQQALFKLYGRGRLASFVEDPQASNGRAARMPGGQPDWAVQYPFTSELDEGRFDTWRCYAVVRCEAKADTGPAFELGVYDPVERRPLATLTETLDNVQDGAYRVYDLGVHKLNRGTYFWVAPPNNEQTVQAVYVDRFFIVGEEKAQQP